MPPENGPQGRRPLKNSPPDRFQPKVVMIWLLVVMAIASLFMMGPKTKGQVLALEPFEVFQELERGNIVSGKIKSDPSGGSWEWSIITGELFVKPGEPLSQGSDLSNYELANAEGKKEIIRFRSDGRLTGDVYQKLQESGKFSEEKSSSLMTELLLGMVPFLIIIGILYFLFVRQLRMAGRGAMSFGKSKARLLTRDRDKVNFNDVAGCDEAKEEVGEVVDFLKDPKRFQRIGGQIPKGILMVGPPGTGKTLLARAVAGEADVPFFTISGSDFVEMFVGVGASRVRDMFEQARKHSPCIVFVDEIDAVGRQRGAGLGGGNDEREQTLNSLLVEMDGFDGHEGVVIIAATNRPDVLDGALLRPGRFDRQVVIDLPDLNGREAILKVHAKKIKLGADVDLRTLAQGTSGFSGADLANLLNEGALIAARYNKKEVDRHDMDEARDKIAFGRERRKLMDEEDRRMTAFHEAGHALVQVLLGDKKLALHKVTIIPRGRALGMTMFTPTKDILGRSKKELLDEICMAMGGRLGEETETGDFSNGAAGDIKQATKTARHMVCDWGMSDLGPVALGENSEHMFLAKEITRSQNYSEETAKRIDQEIRKIINGQYERAKEIIESHREALTLIADALLEFETIEAKHVHEAINDGKIVSPIENNDLIRKEKDQEEEEEKSETEEKKSEPEIGPSPDAAGAMA
ncbi:MAG: cell division protein FtsH [Opitutaceae bacterium]|nr:cell division protein FtsH [Opitutaceae bacterium]|tara:strand:- start:4989 stop:7064 length:2076 start_codon:yes stop_codon:yes gene_type:complete